MAYAFLKASGTPGFYEILAQTGIVGFLTTSSAILGLLVGWLVSLVWNKKNKIGA
jgi:hypothetical protein